ncbi:MAG: hypothetical protein OEV66_02240 [Spirochaetia bacterium]|nr:hypothetical protein [Spirochaetia bacterium]
MTESLFPVDRGSINMDSTRRFYYVAETLTNSGYLRCDVYLPSGKCPESADVEKTGNLFYEIRHKTKKGNHFLFSDAHEKPYHTYKTMVVNLESSGKAIGVVLYSDADESVFSEVLKTLANRQCNKNVIGKWYFIEDRAVLNHLENFYHMKFRNRSMPLQIIEKKGGHYRDADILAKNIINSLKSKTPVSKCLEI